MTQRKLSGEIRIRSSRYWLARKRVLFGGGILFVLLVLGVMLLFSGMFAAEEVDDGRCHGDAECGPGQICAAGGCIILLSSEFSNLWHENVAQQLDEGVEWQPQPEFGEQLKPILQCPVVQSKIEPIDFKKVLETKVSSVYEISNQSVRSYRQSQVEGQIWVDVVRFVFDKHEVTDFGSVCASNDVSGVSIANMGNGANARTVLLAGLRRAVPAETKTMATVSISKQLQSPDENGFRRQVFWLESALGSTERTTVAALPLGSDVTGIEGPPPSRQRLLPGWIVYYWEHSARRSRIALRCRIVEASLPLDYELIRP